MSDLSSISGSGNNVTAETRFPRTLRGIVNRFSPFRFNSKPKQLAVAAELRRDTRSSKERSEPWLSENIKNVALQAVQDDKPIKTRRLDYRLLNTPSLEPLPGVKDQIKNINDKILRAYEQMSGNDSLSLGVRKVVMTEVQNFIIKDGFSLNNLDSEKLEVLVQNLDNILEEMLQEGTQSRASLESRVAMQKQVEVISESIEKRIVNAYQNATKDNELSVGVRSGLQTIMRRTFGVPNPEKPWIERSLKLLTTVNKNLDRQLITTFPKLYFNRRNKTVKSIIDQVKALKTSLLKDEQVRLIEERIVNSYQNATKSKLSDKRRDALQITILKKTFDNSDARWNDCTLKSLFDWQGKLGKLLEDWLAPGSKNLKSIQEQIVYEEQMEVTRSSDINVATQGLSQ